MWPELVAGLDDGPPCEKTSPHASKAMVQMMAVFAEMERDAISKRTKEALTAAKARGVGWLFCGGRHPAAELPPRLRRTSDRPLACRRRANCLAFSWTSLAGRPRNPATS